MSAQYTVDTIVQMNKYLPLRREAVAGHEVTAVWAATGDVITVFVPGDELDPTETDTLIRQAGYKREQARALGGSSS